MQIYLEVFGFKKQMMVQQQIRMQIHSKHVSKNFAEISSIAPFLTVEQN